MHVTCNRALEAIMMHLDIDKTKTTISFRLCVLLVSLLQCDRWNRTYKAYPCPIFPANRLTKPSRLLLQCEQLSVKLLNRSPSALFIPLIVRTERIIMTSFHGYYWYQKGTRVSCKLIIFRSCKCLYQRLKHHDCSRLDVFVVAVLPANVTRSRNSPQPLPPQPFFRRPLALFQHLLCS